MTHLEQFKASFFNAYSIFKGRATRREYWTFTLIVFLAVLLIEGLFFAIVMLAMPDLQQGSPNASVSPLLLAPLVLLGLVFYGLIISTQLPGFVLLVRRLHDTNRSAWHLLWLILPFFGALIILAFLCFDGTQGANRFGEDPKLQNAGR